MSTSTPPVSITKDGPVAILTLNRPPANTFDLEMTAEFSRAVDALRSDASAKVVVVASAMPKIFQGGADVKMMSNLVNSGDFQGFAKFIKDLQGAFNRLSALPHIVIAAINGHALGGGCELALACDLRFMARGGPRIGLPEINFGIFPGGGGTQRLPRLIGHSKALEVIIQGLSFQADEALQLGLVNKVFEPAELMPQTLAFANKLGSGATQAMTYVKQCVAYAQHSSVEDGVAYEGSLFEKATQTADAREGLAAFGERRTPAFKGR